MAYSGAMKRILVALDASSRAVRVLHAALELAVPFDAELRLFRCVVIPTEIPQQLWRTPELDMTPLLIQQADEEMRALSAQVPAERLESAVARVGVPWDMIVREATEFQADLLVMGTKGHGLLDRLLGTTASKVADHAPCNLFLVRDAVVLPTT